MSIEKLQKEIYNEIYDLRRENKNPKFLIVDLYTLNEIKTCQTPLYQPDFGTGAGDIFMGLEVCTTLSETRTLMVV